MIKITHPSKIRITPFFEKTLGAKLNNPRQSWGAIAPASNHVFLRVWEDQIEKDADGIKVKVYWKTQRNKSHGYAERLNHLEAIQNGACGIGILCEAYDPNPVGNKQIKNFDDASLLLLGELSEDDNFIYARIVRSFPIGDLKSLTSSHIGLQNSTIDDIPSAPVGSNVPGRTPTAGSRYQRDESVRRFVIEQAKGTCEYCRELGFLLPDGSRYLEAHHIIALAKQGPDKVENVIALCPSDHREAHYGANRDRLETEMKEIINKRNSSRQPV